ncbi:hypothetical protein ACFTZF_01265 [Streptomyces mirabilis]|uniref:hypothetical protein n=1 Tax=Streptomyces mirabilis TaxID=68239 RepID=UPI00363A9F71
MIALPNKPTAATDDEPRITALAAALHVANATYTDALTTPNPAATLDDICDAWPEIAPQVQRIAKTTPELAEMLKDAIADRLWAYTVVEHARADAGDDYGCVFSAMADALKAGADAQAVRAEVPRVVERLHALEADTDRAKDHA